MRVGDRVHCVPYYGGHISPPVQGRVIYIHPARRYYTVQFDMPRGRAFRESYLIGRDYRALVAEYLEGAGV